MPEEITGLYHGSYTLGDKIGEGGMGVVYEAQNQSGTLAAVKFLKKEFMESEHSTERFQREINALIQCKHPHIVEIWDVGRAPEDLDESLSDAPFFVMERLVGESIRLRLHRVLQRPPMWWVASIGVQLCSAIEAIHQNKLIHRDIKPSNIYLQRLSLGRDFVKLIDFGIVRTHDSQLTVLGGIPGTRPWMSPEQKNGGMVGQASDIYSLGLVLYSLATLEHKPEQFFPKIVRGETPLGAELLSVIRRCADPIPANRFTTAREVAFALWGCVLHEDLEWRLPWLTSAEQDRFFEKTVQKREQNIERLIKRGEFVREDKELLLAECIEEFLVERLQTTQQQADELKLQLEALKKKAPVKAPEVEPKEEILDPEPSVSNQDLLAQLRSSRARALKLRPSKRELQPLFHSGEMSLLESLALSYEIGDDNFSALATSPYVVNLRRLAIGGNELTDRSCETIATSPFLIHLTSLRASVNRFSPNGIRILSSSPNIRALKTLSLAVNPIRKEGAEAIANSPFFSQLSILDLRECVIGDDGAVSLASSSWMASLTTLDLWGNKIGHRGFGSLVSSPYISRLATLSLGDNNLRGNVLRLLPSAAWAKTITTLDLRWNDLRDDDILLFANIGPLPVLSSLNLDGNPLTIEAVMGLLQSPFLSGLRDLCLARDVLTDEQRSALQSEVRFAHVKIRFGPVAT
jgi:serine/threonine protein kinase